MHSTFYHNLRPFAIDVKSISGHRRVNSNSVLETSRECVPHCDYATYTTLDRTEAKLSNEQCSTHLSSVGAG